MTDPPITVAIVNDYEVIVRGLACMLAAFSDRVVVVELAMDAGPSKPVDVALFDTFASRRQSTERARAMITGGLVRHVILYTWDASTEFLSAAESAVVSAVVFKTQTGDGLLEAIEAVAANGPERRPAVPNGQPAGGASLTDRELEVLALIAAGSTNREIAHELFLSVDTVKTHARRLFAKLGVRNRAQAAACAVGHQLPPPALHDSPAGQRSVGQQ